MNILGIIPARGGSKGLKDKNIREVAGKPLIGYTIEAALKSKLLDKVVVSTDSQKIAAVVRKLYSQVQIIIRPAELAGDDSCLEEAMLHTLKELKQQERYQADLVVLMQANLPIRKPGLIDQAIEKMTNSQADSCVSCCEVDQQPDLMKTLNEKGRLKPLFKEALGLPRQKYSKKYLLDGSVVVLRPKNIVKARESTKAHLVLGEEVIPLIQDEKKYSIEIDTLDDLILAEVYLKNESVHYNRR